MARAAGNEELLIQVDGGIGLATAPLVAAAGADVLVCGNAVFKANDPRAAIGAVKGAADEAREVAWPVANGIKRKKKRDEQHRGKPCGRRARIGGRCGHGRGARRCRGRHPARAGGGLHLPGLRRHRPPVRRGGPVPWRPSRCPGLRQLGRERQRRTPLHAPGRAAFDRSRGAPAARAARGPGRLGAPTRSCFTSGATEADDAARPRPCRAAAAEQRRLAGQKRLRPFARRHHRRRARRRARALPGASRPRACRVDAACAPNRQGFVEAASRARGRAGPTTPCSSRVQAANTEVGSHPAHPRRWPSGRARRGARSSTPMPCRPWARRPLDVQGHGAWTPRPSRPTRSAAPRAWAPCT